MHGYDDLMHIDVVLEIIANASALPDFKFGKPHTTIKYIEQFRSVYVSCQVQATLVIGHLNLD